MILDFIGGIFGGRRRKQKVCHSYKCAQCTSNHHCHGNQVCSGYTCVNPQTYNNYENPANYWTTTTQRPYYNDYNNYNNKYNDNNFWETSTYKSYVPKNDYFDTSKYTNFDTSKYNNFDTSSFDTSSSFSAADFGAF